MIENKNDASRNLEKALQALQQAKQRVANEKKKQNEKKRKAENHHKYIMGGIVVKYFPDCYCYDEGELNRILSVALQTRECQQAILRNSLTQAALATHKRSPASIREHLRSDKSQSEAFIYPQSLWVRPSILSAECRCCVWVMSQNRQAHVSP